MSFEGRPPVRPPEPPEPQGPSGATLLVALVLAVAIGYGLVVKLRDMGRIQDCVMSGRTNCAPIETGR